MSRLLQIARREYVSYVRTVGFWLSLCLMPLVLGVSVTIPAMMDKAAPVPRLAIVDLSGEGLGAALIAALQDGAGVEPPAAVVVAAPPALRAAGDAEAAGRILRRIMRPAGRQGATFDAAAVLSGTGDRVRLDLWTANLLDNRLQDLLSDDLRNLMRRHRLSQAGVAAPVIEAADRLEPKVSLYSPGSAGAGQVSWRDRLPSIAGFAMGLLLWSVILTGAGILLNSVIEEKSSRILEVLLTSASVPEVMGGKILGVAGVTATVLAVWAAVGAAAAALIAPGLGAEILAALLGKGLALYFVAYLVVGYLMYASIFAAIGAFCETTREAQTLLGPVMLMLTVPVIFMGQSIRHPDAPVLQFLSWLPPFTPFLMVARAASAPPAWQIGGTLALMSATTAVVVWLSGRAFRSGALSIGKLDGRAVLDSLIRRPG